MLFHTDPRSSEICLEEKETYHYPLFHGFPIIKTNDTKDILIGFLTVEYSLLNNLILEEICILRCGHADEILQDRNNVK